MRLITVYMIGQQDTIYSHCVLKPLFVPTESHNLVKIEARVCTVDVFSRTVGEGPAHTGGGHSTYSYREHTCCETPEVDLRVSIS